MRRFPVIPKKFVNALTDCYRPYTSLDCIEKFVKRDNGAAGIMILFSLALVGRNIMARIANLTNMDVGQLLELRKQIDATLSERRGDLEKQLRELGSLTDSARARVGASPLAGKKVPPKYRLGNQTWAGRGQKPKWLVAAMKDSGKNLDDFLIAKSGAKKRRAKR